MFIFANKTAQNEPWNKGKLTGQKPPLLPKHVWAIRTKFYISMGASEISRFSISRSIASYVAAIWSD